MVERNEVAQAMTRTGGQPVGGDTGNETSWHIAVAWHDGIVAELALHPCPDRDLTNAQRQRAPFAGPQSLAEGRHWRAGRNKMFETINLLDTEPAEGGNSAHEYLAEPNGFGVIRRMTAGGAGKVLLPRRSGESRFGPRQYYYP